MAQPDDELRAADADRDRAAAAIRDHYAAGRLNDEELSQRLQAVYASRTLGQLRELQRDLPALPATVSQQRVELAARRAHLQRRLLQQTGGGLGCFAICVAVWAASGAQGTFWPVWVLLVALLPLVRNGWYLYGPAPDLDRVEAELARRERHARRRERSARRQAERRLP
jgi:hypothetical protein